MKPACHLRVTESYGRSIKVKNTNITYVKIVFFLFIGPLTFLKSFTVRDLTILMTFQLRPIHGY